MYLINALPMSIIPATGGTLILTPITAGKVPAGVVSAIGHADTAAVISGLLGRPVPMARVSVPTLEVGQVHYIAAYQGPRLPEGSTTLPKGAEIKFYRLEVAPLSAVQPLPEERFFWGMFCSKCGARTVTAADTGNAICKNGCDAQQVRE